MNSTSLKRGELASAVCIDKADLADLLWDAGRGYDRLLDKLDLRAAGIIETMERLRASIARSRETDPSTLSINGLGELQGQGPELDRLCGEVDAQRNLLRRLNEILLPPQQPGHPNPSQKGVTS